MAIKRVLELDFQPKIFFNPGLKIIQFTDCIADGPNQVKVESDSTREIFLK